MRDLGDNLSRFGNAIFLSGASPEELQRQLQELRIRYEIISIYAQGSNHIAWINPAIKVIKKQKTKIKGDENG
jgi:SOS response regulatory protein OraA/RecX